ncbi:MAG: histidine kinase [Nostoc sp.]
MGSGEWGDEGAGEEELITNAQCPIPNALFPIPYSLFPIPYSLLLP